MRILFFFALGLSASSAGLASELVVRGDGLVSGTVNGVPTRIRIDPGAAGMPILTSDLARRALLKAGPFDFDYLVGPKRVEFKSAVSRIDFGLGPLRRRVGWTGAPYRPGADVIIGPGLLPVSSVRFDLRPPRPGERETVLPMVGQGGMGEAWGERFGLINIGGIALRVQFDPGRARTVATASAGAGLARVLGGRLSGNAEAVEIAFGVSRPVRSLRFERPLLVGSIAVPEMSVRTQDFGSVRGISEAGADPDEILVVARPRKKPRVEQIKLGADVLDQCSSIVFDRGARQVRLRCL